MCFVNIKRKLKEKYLDHLLSEEGAINLGIKTRNQLIKECVIRKDGNKIDLPRGYDAIDVFCINMIDKNFNKLKNRTSNILTVTKDDDSKFEVHL